MFSIKTQLLRRLGLALLCAGVAIGSGTVFGFTLMGPTRELEDAYRWSNVPGSLVENGVQGLGGGIEYAVADDFCDKMIPLFLDDPQPTCEQLREVIKRAFDKWTVGHPILRFTDVTGKIRPELPPARSSARDFGAEIDIFALPPTNPSAGGQVRWHIRPARPLGTNGKELPGQTITSMDIFIYPGRCFFLDPKLKDRRHPSTGGRCAYFEDLLMHEIGHTLALAHTHEFPYDNWDSDDDPTNEIPIDCEDPTKGLKRSPNWDRQSIMSYTHEARAELTNDDISGRNFLYPICPSSSVAFIKTRSYQMVFTEY